MQTTCTSSNPKLSRALQRVGNTFAGRYSIIQLIDAGGFGAVYKALDPQDAVVAIKIPHDSSDPDSNATLQREYNASRRLMQHPGVVQIFDQGMTSNFEPFLAMEFLDGRTLESQRMSNGGKLCVPEVVLITLGILRALEAAHSARVVHADVKPHNVMVGSGKGVVKVIDWGLSKIGRLTVATPADDLWTKPRDYVVGTLGFMSPEQANGEIARVDARSDIFSVGATMHLLLSGRLVHETAGPMDFLSRMACVQAPSLAAFAPHVPASIVKVVDTALRLDPNERYANARMMRNALESTFDSISR